MKISHTLKDLLAIADNNSLVKGAVSLKQLCNRATFRQDTMQEKNKSNFQTVGGDNNNYNNYCFHKKIYANNKVPKVHTCVLFKLINIHIRYERNIIVLFHVIIIIILFINELQNKVHNN